MGEKTRVCSVVLALGWCVALLVMLVGFFFLTATLWGPVGCWFGGCEDMGLLELGIGDGGVGLEISGTGEADSWKYYKVSLKTFANNMKIYSGGVEGDVCMGFSRSFFKPSSCNLPTNYQDDNALFCLTSSNVVIGVYSRTSGPFSFHLELTNPYNSMAGLGCGFLFMGVIAIVILFIIIYLLPLFCCSLCLIARTARLKQSEFLLEEDYLY